MNISYVPQRDRIDTITPVTVLEVVMIRRLARTGAFHRIGADDAEAARQTLNLLGVASLEGRLFRNLSAGQKQRVLSSAAAGHHRISAESLMGWAYAAASSATVLILSQVAGGSTDTMYLLFGNVLAVPATHVMGLTALVGTVNLDQLLLMPRFVLVTFDPEAARIAGGNTRLWSLSLNMSIGVVSSAAVHEIGALSTFALLSLPAMAALLLTASIRSAFMVAAGLGITVPVLALAISF